MTPYEIPSSAESDNDCNSNMWEILISNYEPMVHPIGSEAHDKKCLVRVDFYWKLLNKMLDNLTDEVESCTRIGLQYESVLRVYDVCVNDLEILRDYLSDYIEDLHKNETLLKKGEVADV